MQLRVYLYCILKLVFFPVSDPNAPNVQVTQMSLICDTAPTPLVLDLQGESLLCSVIVDVLVTILGKKMGRVGRCNR